MQGPLVGPRYALRPDAAVELVLDLQQGRRQLDVRPVRAAQPQRLVGWVRDRQGSLQRPGVAVQAVVADVEDGLRVALIAQTPHAQRGGVGQAVGARTQFLQPMCTACDEAAAHHGRSAKEIEQQKRMPSEVADQPEVVVVRQTRHRPVVVDARDRLHAAAISMTEACAVDTLHARQVGSSVAGDRDVLVNRQSAGHARRPERLFANFTQDLLVQLSKLRHAGVDGAVRASDQFDLRLAEVGSDVRMAQRRAQCCRVR